MTRGGGTAASSAVGFSEPPVVPLPKYFIFVCLINIIFWLWAREPTRCSTLCIFANGNDYANLSQEQKLEQRWWWWGWWLWLWRWSRLLDNLDIRCQMEIRSSRSSAHNKSTSTRGILGVSKVYMGLSVAIPTLNIIKEMRDEGDCASFLMQIQIQLKWTISNRNEQFRILKLALDEESAELTSKCESRIYILASAAAVGSNIWNSVLWFWGVIVSQYIIMLWPGMDRVFIPNSFWPNMTLLCIRNGCCAKKHSTYAN